MQTPLLLHPKLVAARAPHWLRDAAASDYSVLPERIGATRRPTSLRSLPAAGYQITTRQVFSQCNVSAGGGGARARLRCYRRRLLPQRQNRGRKTCLHGRRHVSGLGGGRRGRPSAIEASHLGNTSVRTCCGSSESIGSILVLGQHVRRNCAPRSARLPYLGRSKGLPESGTATARRARPTAMGALASARVAQVPSVRLSRRSSPRLTQVTGPRS